MEEVLKKKIAEVETVLTYDVYKEFSYFSIKKRKGYKDRPKLIYGLSALLFLVSIFGVLTSDDKDIYISMIIINIIVISCRAVVTEYLPKKNYRNKAKFFNNPIKYTFFEDYILTENNNEAAKGTSEIKYESFYKIYELDNVIYAFIDNFQAFIITKNQLSKENLEKIREIFDSKLGKKYYKYY